MVDQRKGFRLEPSRKELIDELKRLKVAERGDFVLASGKRSDYYVNIKRAVTHPRALKLIAENMAFLAENPDKIAGVELGAVPIAVAVALELNLPYIIVRKAKKEHGTKARIEGGVELGEKIVFVEDVTTTANTLKNSIILVREMGGIVDKALVVVDRNEGAVENLRSIDIELIPLVKVEELL